MQIGLNPLDSCLFSLRSPSIFRQSFGDKDEATPRIQPAPIHPRRRSSGSALPCLIPYLPPLVLDTANILLKLNAGAALKVCRVEIIRQPGSETRRELPTYGASSPPRTVSSRGPKTSSSQCEFLQIFAGTAFDFA